MNDTGSIPEAATILRLWWKEGQPGETFVLPFLSNTEDYAKYDREEIHNAPYDVRFPLRRDINKGTVVINRALALLSTEAGLKRPSTTHSARHSVADLARRIMESGGEITKTDIQSMLVHSDFKIDLSDYDEMYLQIIDNLIYLSFGTQAAELIIHYCYDRLEMDGSIPYVDADGNEREISDPEQLWQVVKKLL